MQESRVKWCLDDRGWVDPQTVELTIAEVKRCGWLYCPMRLVPGWAQVAVQKHRDAYDLATRREEMQARYATGRWHPSPDPRRQPGFISEMFERAAKVSNNSESSDVDSN